MLKIQKRYLTEVFPALMLVFTFFCFGTASIFIKNTDEFWFAFGDILPVLLALSTFFFAATLLMEKLLPAKFRKYLQAAVYALTFSFFVQGYVLGNSFGLLDGKDIDWGQHWVSGLVSSLVWLAIFAAAVIAIQKDEKKARSAMNFLLVVTLGLQVFILTYSLVRRKESDVKKDVFLTTDGAFNLSKNNNTIVFLLDRFDAKLFASLLEHEEYQLQEKFEDFTFYRNMSGGTSRTKYAIPYLFTGRTITEPVSYMEYIHKSFADSPFVQELRKGKVDARVLTDAFQISTDETKAFANIRDGRLEVSRPLHMALHFCKLTAFCFVPVPAKRFFWMYPDFERWTADQTDRHPYLTDDVRFRREMQQELNASMEKDVFRFYHLFGAHGAYTMSENCTRIPKSVGTEERQARGSLKIVLDFIVLAKELGIYDDMTIFVMADHGGIGIEQNPLFMLKERKKSKPFSISDAPCTYKDMPLIYRDAVTGTTINMDKRYSHPGEERIVYDWIGTSKLSLVEYSSTGHASDESSYKKTGRVFHGNNGNKPEKYKIGNKLFFSAQETANQYCIDGFIQAEIVSTWTEGPKAEMLFPLKSYRQGEDLILSMEYEMFKEGQQVGIIVNGHEIARYAATGGKKEILVPASCMQNNEIHLLFDLPDTDYPDNDSMRTLGMMGISFRYAKESFWGWITDNPWSVAYSMTIGLIEAFVGWIFTFILAHLPGIGVIGAVAGVSLIINFLALPLYNFADNMREKERQIVKALEYRVKRIKKAFKGDERFMMLSTYYRQNNYSPLYAMRSSLSILIEIPLFIAAYQYLSHCEELRDASFWIVKDLGSADGLLRISISGKQIAVNILPILMTAINTVSGTIYTKNASKSERIQQYALAAIFLILLYKSPSGLVLYWIMNNIFSLVKNIVSGFRAKESK